MNILHYVVVVQTEDVNIAIEVSRKSKKAFVVANLQQWLTNIFQKFPVMVNIKHFQPQGGIILILFVNFLFHLCLIIFSCKKKYGESSRGLNLCFFYDLKRSLFI